MSVNGISKENSVIFMMDNNMSVPARRVRLADMINQAVEQGARMIVLDIYFVDYTEVDEELQKAFDNAAVNNIPVIIGAPPCEEINAGSEQAQCSESRFTQGVKLGHIIADAKPEDGVTSWFSRSSIPNPNAFPAKRKFDGISYTSVPLLAARELCRGDERIDIDIEHYKDLNEDELPPTMSYNDYSLIDLKGMIVFVGGNVAPLTGEPVDQVTTDNGNLSHGIYDMVSATFTLTDLLCHGQFSTGEVNPTKKKK